MGTHSNVTYSDMVGGMRTTLAELHLLLGDLEALVARNEARDEVTDVQRLSVQIKMDQIEARLLELNLVYLRGSIMV